MAISISRAIRKTRNVMGVIIDDSGGQTIQNRLASPTAVMGLATPLRTQHIRKNIVAKMSIPAAPRKSGTLGGRDATAADGRKIGPPGAGADATITGRKMGLGGMILIGVAIITVIALLGGRRR